MSHHDASEGTFTWSQFRSHLRSKSADGSQRGSWLSRGRQSSQGQRPPAARSLPLPILQPHAAAAVWQSDSNPSKQECLYSSPTFSSARRDAVGLGARGRQSGEACSRSQASLDSCCAAPGSQNTPERVMSTPHAPERVRVRIEAARNSPDPASAQIYKERVRSRGLTHWRKHCAVPAGCQQVYRHWAAD
jgi:hypothetical protein